MAGDAELYFNPQQITIEAGNTYQTTLNFTNFTSLQGMELELSFDPALIEIKDLSLEGDLAKALTMEKSFDNTKGIIRYSGALTKPVYGPGPLPLMKISFKTLKLAEGFLKITKVTMVDENVKGIVATTKEFSLKVVTNIPTPLPISEPAPAPMPNNPVAPELQPNPEQTPESAPEPIPNQQIETPPAPQPETKPELKPDPKPETKPAPKPIPKPQPPKYPQVKTATLGFSGKIKPGDYVKVYVNGKYQGKVKADRKGSYKISVKLNKGLNKITLLEVTPKGKLVKVISQKVVERR